MQHYSRLAYDKTPRSSGHIILEGKDMESFNKEVRPGIQTHEWMYKNIRILGQSQLVVYMVC